MVRRKVNYFKNFIETPVFIGFFFRNNSKRLIRLIKPYRKLGVIVKESMPKIDTNESNLE